MLTDNEEEQISGNVTDMVDDYDVYANSTRDLSEDSSDASNRALARVLPLVFGGLFGGLADSTPLGLLGGLAISVAFDLSMGDNSIMRMLSQSMFKYVCPAIAGGAQMSVRMMKRLGLKMPSRLAEMRCH